MLADADGGVKQAGAAPLPGNRVAYRISIVRIAHGQSPRGSNYQDSIDEILLNQIFF